jgi:hypothetical protein
MSEMPDQSARCLRTVDVGAFLLGGLSAEEAARFEAHLTECEHCQAARDELSPLTVRMGALDLTPLRNSPGEPSAALRDRLLATAVAESHEGRVVDLSDAAAAQHARRRRRFPMRAAGAAALAFAVGAGSGYSVRPAAEQAPPTTRQSRIPPGYEGTSQRVDFVTTGADQTEWPEAYAVVSAGAAGTYAALYTKNLTVGESYKWWLETSDGYRIAMGSFVFPGDVKNWLICPGSTSVERVKLKAVGATNAAGVDILRAYLPPLPA